ncbi:EAL domain-containing protein [Halobacillus litoralis]|uniref:sensor domain-containing protein n=1 Tax=Halobacillus litoralis TaxID=45668 RepID=UPI001CD6D6C0|nr:EAL domain-containing protein [Halobacillus litoralis]MCA0969484.1 EAL domain-containing protein [Halobacillus litoralis]
MSHRNEKELPIHEWLFEHFRDPLLFVDHSDTIVQCNPSANRLLGEVSGESIHRFLPNHHWLEQRDRHHVMEWRGKKKGSFQVKSLRLDEELYALIFVPVSLTEQKRMMKENGEEWVSIRSEGMVMHADGRIIDCDATFARMFGYEPSELINRDVYSLTTEDHHHRLMNIETNGAAVPVPFEGKKKDGRAVFVEIAAHRLAQDDRLRVAIVRDVTERVHNERRIEFMSYYDEMTDLPNRMYFNEILSEAIHEASGRGEKLAVHFIDIDYFKQINDTLGYSFGDRFLKACAERLKQRNGGHTFVARMGGDEFLVLQRHIASEDEAETYAQDMIDTFKRPVSIEGYDLFTTISIGISFFPSQGATADDLIKQADSAMYTVKESQRNNFMSYDSSMTKKFETMLSVETELRKAIKRDELQIHYQPQKSILTGKVVGMEALVRWLHPAKGFIPPSSFIPIAEKNGQIVEIGEWVMREACYQNKKWQDEGFDPVIVGVNLSAIQFRQKDIVHRVRKILDETKLDPYYLELEITESMAMTNEEYIIQTLNDLRSLGVHVSIDDFGTGYSSLKYLSRFPVSKLKIDKAFINENQEQNQAIVKSIIHMSHSLNMKVIAEGVETAEQLAFLKEERCDEMQGYYYSRPLPPEELSSIFTRGYVH